MLYPHSTLVAGYVASKSLLLPVKFPAIWSAVEFLESNKLAFEHFRLARFLN